MGEPREGAQWPNIVAFAAARYLLPKYLEPITYDDVVEAREVFREHFGPDSEHLFNEAGWSRILMKYDGQLPLRIRMLPEGTIVPVGNSILAIENLGGQQLGWLTNYVETRLSHIWYPMTIATQSWEARKLILRWLETTGDSALVDFKLHDFGYRGVTCEEQAMIGGLAHLTSFRGTDNVAALVLGRRKYDTRMAGYSIPAAEHSTITSWGRSREAAAYRNMLQKYPTGLVAVVSDSYDLMKACEELWGIVLHDEVMSRNGTLVIRPDSGKPSEVVPDVLDVLRRKFPCYDNQKGYHVLDSHVRVIQGDGIKPPVDAIDDIYRAMANRGWSADNVAFGSGGGLLQDVNRDTQRFAIKCSAIRNVSGEWEDVYKQPKTDLTKASKSGRMLSVYTYADGRPGVWTHPEGGYPDAVDRMVEVYNTGQFNMPWSLDDVRARVAAGVIG
jgi:nicotinamide phosphoribosyltransferase